MNKENPREKQYKFCPTCAAELNWKMIETRNYLCCPKCDFVFWNNPKPVTSAVIVKDNKVLMIKRNRDPLKGYWVLPGGYIDYEEKPEEAVIRETKEETNLDIKPEKLVGVYRINNDPTGVNIDIIYLASIVSGELKINDEEASEYGFFSVDELPEQIPYKHRDAIIDWDKKFNN